MNMHDLSRDDDFLSHLLVEKLGTGDVPLVVYKMDPSRRLPKTNAEELLNIVRKVSKLSGQSSYRLLNTVVLSPTCLSQMVVTKGSQQTIIRQAVDELLKYVVPMSPRFVLTLALFLG